MEYNPQIMKQEKMGSDPLGLSGDIWVKESTENVGLQRAHIAIIASVPEYTEGMTVFDFMNQMVLIEAVYTNKIQSVIKKLSVGDYNHNNLTIDKAIYTDPNYLIIKDQNGFSLNCKSWSIRRLK